MTWSAQNRDIHQVKHEMVQNSQVSGNHLDSQEPKAHVGDVPNIKFLPDIHDQSRQRLNYVILVSRILLSHFECFRPFQNVCIQHIPHKYNKEQSMKSVKVSVLSLQAILNDQPDLLFCGLLKLRIECVRVTSQQPCQSSETPVFWWKCLQE